METCCIKGCEKTVEALGLCINHWRRNKLYGSPAAYKSHSGLFRGMPAVDRFWRQTKKGDGCWLWQASVDKDGYGVFRGVINGVQLSRAHRFSYALHKGAIAEGLEVCHSCDVPRCVNPDHLTLGTTKQNQQDKWRKGRGRVAFGEKSGKAILTEAQALAILKDPRTYTQIAADYNVAPSTIGSIKQRVSWPHLKIE